MSRNITFAPNEYYHIYNRGTEKRNIFLNKKDYERFSCLLYICNSEVSVRIDNFNKQIFKQGSTLLQNLEKSDRGKPLVDICIYCLMPNHFHLIIRELEEGGVSKFMQKILTGYTMYFNKKHERNGTLFQGKFKAIHIDNDVYMKYLIAYVHLNPIKLINSKWKEEGIRNKERAIKYLEQFEYSSYRDYIGIERVKKILLNKSALPDYSRDTASSYETMISEWLNYKDL